MMKNLRRATVPLALVTSLAACEPGGSLTLNPPPAQGNYRAQGNEPGWNLTMNSRRTDFVGNNGSWRITQNTPRPTFRQGSRTYRTQRLTITVIRARCTDSMSGRVFPDRVRVVADGRPHDGCGADQGNM